MNDKVEGELAKLPGLSEVAVLAVIDLWVLITSLYALMSVLMASFETSVPLPTLIVWAVTEALFKLRVMPSITSVTVLLAREKVVPLTTKEALAAVVTDVSVSVAGTPVRPVKLTAFVVPVCVP